MEKIEVNIYSDEQTNKEIPKKISIGLKLSTPINICYLSNFEIKRGSYMALKNVALRNEFIAS